MIKLPPAALKKFNENYLQIFETGALAEGKWNKSLADFFLEYTGATNSSAVSSNGAGLLAVLMLLRHYRGYKHIFIQANTMYGVKTIAQSSGMNYIGEVPSSLPSLMPSFEQFHDFAMKLSDPSKTVFLLTHIGGIANPDIARISDLCKQMDIALVEDAAHSLGTLIDDKHTGLFGIAGVYSLYATKAVPAGEGGIVVTNDEDLGEKLSKFIIYDRFDQQLDIGINFRISEMQALLSLAVCELSEEIIQSKSQIAARYIETCEQLGIAFVDPYQNGQRGNHYKFTLIAENDAKTEFASITNRTSPVYDYAIGSDPDNIAGKHICLPIWYGLEDTVINATIDELQRSRS